MKILLEMFILKAYEHCPSDIKRAKIFEAVFATIFNALCLICVYSRSNKKVRESIEKR